MLRVLMKTQDRIHNIKFVLNTIHWKAIFLFILIFRFWHVDSWLEYFLLLVHSFELQSCVKTFFLHAVINSVWRAHLLGANIF